ncbi:MAG: SO_0444 family Cu/Zn efflux transporter [Proteobacteria bacterium]|nr:SO_0444 family Cu/Zn efflux transporter [Pseudomonadota bacterium]
MAFLLSALTAAWGLLLESSAYVLFGLLVAGLLRVFLSPASVARHFGQGRFLSVFKASLLGIPIPLCSCGVLPAAVSLKKQGANNGAVTSFLISTPESGVDSIAITYGLLGPVMTVVRPLAALVTALAAGMTENLLGYKKGEKPVVPDFSCPVDGCCTGEDCDPDEHRNHHGFFEKIVAGMRFAFTDVWADMAGWFAVGILLAGVIMALVPADALGSWLGGGMGSMLLMLALGIPLYICATASTPVAAALILKGVSPGAALVFLLAGPATNVTSLTVLLGVLGKRATAIYLTSIAVFSVAFGLATDALYGTLGLSPQALVAEAGELLPLWAEYAGAVALILLSVPIFVRRVRRRFQGKPAPACGITLGSSGGT